MRNTNRTWVNKLFWGTSILFLLCILTFLFYACSGSSGGGGGEALAEESSTQAKWTILSYIDGNNNHDDTAGSGTSYYIRKVQDMEQIGSTDEVKIVTMVSSLSAGGTAKYYRVDQHTNEQVNQISSKELKDAGSVDMSDPATLEKFVNYVLDQEEYQADHYMLVLADHGSGWTGLCIDNKSGTYMDMNELNKALTNIDHKFDIIAFDACLMGMVEVAYEIADFADYMVASQNVMYIIIDLAYSEWLEKLVNDPDMDPRTVCDNVTKAVYNKGEANDFVVSTSVIDLSKIQQLGSALGIFSSDLYLLGGKYNIQNAREKCHENPDDPVFIDLKQFIVNIKDDTALNKGIANKAEKVIDALNEACIFNKGNDSDPNNGLSIFFPKMRNKYPETTADEYESIQFSETKWYKFVQWYIDTFGDAGGEGGDGEYIDSSVSGTVVWPDHDLPSTIIAFLDSSTTDSITVEAAVLVDPATGKYSFNLSLNNPLVVTVWACYDIDGDGIIWEEGENTFGWSDNNGDGSWSVDDMITINPGDTETVPTIVMYSWE